MGNQLSTEAFIEKARNVHGNRYDYRKTEYVKSSSKVIITCKEHGDFEQTPNSHISNEAGCPVCRKELMSSKFRDTPDQMIKKFKKTHGNRYIYHIEGDPISTTKIKIECKDHGIFTQRVSAHIKGSGCPVCAQDERNRKSAIDIRQHLSGFKEIHGDKYDYSLIDLNRRWVSKDKVEIVCPVHGNFLQMIMSHKAGKGCPKCGMEKAHFSRRKGAEGFIIEANKVHNSFYDYSKVNYQTCKDKVKIICPKHGGFMQTPDGHLQGKGCAKCTQGYSGPSKKEYELLDIIKEINPNVIHSDRSIIRPKELDFVFPDLKLAIEYNGHFYHGVEKRDVNYHQTKYELAKEKGYKLLTIWDFDFLEKKDQVKKYLKMVLTGVVVNDIRPVYVGIEPIKRKTAEEFYKNNSLFNAGVTKGTCYGMYADSELAAVICMEKDLVLKGNYILNYYAGLNYSKSLFHNLLNGVKKINSDMDHLTFNIQKDNRSLWFLEDVGDKILVSEDNVDLYRYHYKYGVCDQYEWSGSRFDDKLKELEVVSNEGEELQTLKDKHNLRTIFTCGHNTYRIDL